MKHILKFLSVMLALLVICSVTVYAADSYFTVDGFMVYINSNGEAVISEYKGNSKNVVIPLALMGAKVTAIDDYAFFNNTDLKSVSFEEAEFLNYIGTDAFYGCTGLQVINIPSSVKEIGFAAFQNCTNLKNVTLGNGICSIGNQAFYNCSSVEKIVIPEGVESLGDWCFSGCTSLKDIGIPDSVTSISDNALMNVSKDLVIYCSENSYAAEFARENSTESKVPKVYELGDANLDGKVNIRDATTIQIVKVGKMTIPTYRGDNYADVNRDGQTNICDATLIQMKIAGIINDF